MNIFVNMGNSENAMVFTKSEKITPDMIFKLCQEMDRKSKGKYNPIEAYAVKDEDCQYYCYEPCWFTEEGERKILERFGGIHVKK